MESISDLQTHGLKFIQDDRFFPFGTDGVELANFAQAKLSDRVLDLCCGSGIVTVLLAGKKGVSVTGVELQAELASLAEKNIKLNNLPCKIICDRVQNLPSIFPAGSFDVITCNPPYRKVGSGMESLSDQVRIARHEVALTLDELLRASSHLLKSGGKMYIVHIVERLAEVFDNAIKYHLQPKVLSILRPGDNKKPFIFLAKLIKDGKVGLEVLPERNVLGSTGMEYPE